MKILSTEFARDGFRFKQITRRGQWAAYRKTKKGAGGLIESYEVARIRTRKDHQIKDRVIEGGEFYPSAKEWGTHGFTFCTEQEAREALNRLTTSTRETTGIDPEAPSGSQPDSQPVQTIKTALTA